MKLGANTYSWLWSGTPEEAVREIGKSGLFSAVEFLISPPHFSLSEYRPGMYRGLRRIVEDYGMEVLSLNIPSLDINPASPFAEMREMTVSLYKRLVPLALELGAKILIIPPGKRHPLLPPDYGLIYSYAKDSLRQILDCVKDSGLIIGIETLPALFMDTVAQLQSFIQDLNDDQLKMVFDAANVFNYEDPAEALRQTFSDICLLHLSDTQRNKWQHNVLGTGNVDSASFLEAAEAKGYDGYLVLEVISDKGISGLQTCVRSLNRYGFMFK